MSGILTFPGEYPSPFHYFEADEAIRYEEEKFTECRAVKLFYVIYGRNAWHDTWVTKYFDGCMNPSLVAAKQTSENKRVQGSVFYISEIPALQFISDKFSILVAEINSVQPLQHIQEMPEDEPLTAKTIYDHFAPINQNSIIRLAWKSRRFRATDSGLEKISYTMRELNPLIKSEIFKKFKSYSHGKDYLLGWNEIDHKMSSSAVLRLAEQFDSMIVNHKIKEFVAICSDMAEKYMIPIEDEFSIRTKNILKNAGIRFIGDLVQFTATKLQQVVAIEKNFNEIMNVLAEMGVALKPEKISSGINFKDKPVDDLELSVRTANVLKNAKISTIGQLVEYSQADLLRLQNMGRKSVNELTDVLSELGLLLEYD